jgi:hypothetical protein
MDLREEDHLYGQIIDYEVCSTFCCAQPHCLCALCLHDAHRCCLWVCCHKECVHGCKRVRASKHGWLQDFEIEMGRRHFTQAELQAIAEAEAPAGASLAPVPASLAEEKPVYRHKASGQSVYLNALIMLPPVRNNPLPAWSACNYLL